MVVSLICEDLDLLITGRAGACIGANELKVVWGVYGELQNDLIIDGSRGDAGAAGSFFRLMASLEIRILEKTVQSMPPLLGTAAKPRCLVALEYDYQ
jgi:hypothetical protein